jgi:ABC-type iron transport system FetAB permease component
MRKCCAFVFCDYCVYGKEKNSLRFYGIYIVGARVALKLLIVIYVLHNIFKSHKIVVVGEGGGRIWMEPPNFVLADA